MNIITGLSEDTVYGYLCKLNCHDSWKLCWPNLITESVCTWTSLNQDFLLWLVSHNQNTVATRRVTTGWGWGVRGNATPIPKFSG